MTETLSQGMDPHPDWMLAAPLKWRVSLDVHLEFGVRELSDGSGSGPAAYLSCTLPDMPDERKNLEMVRASPAVSWADGSLRVHLGDRHWDVGWWEQLYTAFCGVEKHPTDDEYQPIWGLGWECGDLELVEEMGLTEVPLPARMSWWRASRLMRDETGSILRSQDLPLGQAPRPRRRLVWERAGKWR